MYKTGVLLLAILGMMVPRHLRASHIMGSDISYRCLGNDQYEITVTIYRDCNGIALTNSPISIICEGSVSGRNYTLPQISVRDITGIGANCPVKSRCQGGGYPYGIEEYIFRQVIDLSWISCCEVVVGWRNCCRNNSITTGAAKEQFYTEAVINKCLSSCNSSPVFTTPPAALVCVGQDFVFNNGATDIIDKNDSFTYRVIEPQTERGKEIPYLAPYSSANPLNVLGGPGAPLPGGFHVDAITGDIRFRPIFLNQITVIVLEVTEWRKINEVMTVIGRTQRDIQVIVADCQSTTPPTLSGSSKSVCPNEQVCIDFTTDDPDKDDIVTLEWNGGIPGASFSTNNGQVKFAKGKLCWTPTENEGSTVPYQFTVTARDNSCPFTGQAIRAFSITVFEVPKATRLYKKITCKDFKLEYVPLKSTYENLVATWEIMDNKNNIYYTSGQEADTVELKHGINVVTLSLKNGGRCINRYFDTILVDTAGPLVTMPNDTTLCSNIKHTVAPIVNKYSRGTPEFLWYVNPNVIAPHLTVNSAMGSSIAVKLSDAPYCFRHDTINITWKSAPKVNLGPDLTLCQVGEHLLVADTAVQGIKYIWNTGDTTPFIRVIKSGQYIVRASSASGCNVLDTAVINLRVANIYAGPDYLVCTNDNVLLSASGCDVYQWYEATTGQINVVSTKPLFNYAASRDVKMVAQGKKFWGAEYCVLHDTVSIKVKPLPAISFLPLDSLCLDAATKNLEGLALPLNGIWSGDGVSMGKFDAYKSGPGSIELQYNYMDAVTRCSATAITHIYVQDTPTMQLVLPAAACADLPVPLSATVRNAGGIHWSTLGDGSFDNENGLTTNYNTGAQDRALKLFTLDAVTTGNGVCKASRREFILTVEPLPSALIQALPETGCEPLEVTVNAITDLPGNAKYDWHFGDMASGANNTSNLAATAHTYEKQGDYTMNLRVTSAKGCSDKASPVSIKVNPTPVANFTMDPPKINVSAATIQFTNRSTIQRPGTITSHKWSFGDAFSTESSELHPKFKYPEDTGHFAVSLWVISDQNCPHTHTQTLYIYPDFAMFIPTAFTPNRGGPEGNNRFYVHAEGHTEVEVTIFNRWGEVIYQSANLQEGWDGTYNGKAVPSGVYVFMVQGTAISGRQHVAHGTVTLLE